MTNQNQTNAAQAAGHQSVVEAIMEQAQAFASAWSLVGGRFDDGNMAENARESKQRLFDMVSKLRAEGVQAGDERALLDRAEALVVDAIKRMRAAHVHCQDLLRDAEQFLEDRAALANAPVALNDLERKAVAGLLAVARAAFNVADDAEDDGDHIKVGRADAEALGAALDTLDELPDDQPGYAMGPSNKAEWALRRVLVMASAPVAEPYDSEKRCRAYYDSDLRPFAADGLTYSVWQSVWHAAQFDRAMHPDSSKQRPHSAPVAAEAQPYRPTKIALREACDLLDKIKKSHGYWGGWSSIPSVCDEAIGLLRYSGTQAAPQASEAVRNAALEEAYEAVACLYAAYFQHREHSVLGALKQAGDDIRALKLPQADKDGADCAKGAGDVVLPPLPQTIAWATVNSSLATAVDDLRRAAVLADRQQRTSKEPQ